MDEEIEVLQGQIRVLEEQLEQKHAEKRQKKFHYRVEGRNVVFDAAVEAQHAKQRTTVLSYMLNLSLKAHLTGWAVYSMIVPFVFLDLCVTLYQIICFWAWEIPKAKRSDYVFIDRHHLAYLNGAEKIYCMYCGYANGVTAFTREVTGRTEKHWCPIKHASRTLQVHEHYKDFIDYGDADGWHKKDNK